MIEAIARLIQESGASQVQLNITTNEHGAQIVLNTKLGDMPANATTQVMALRSALSRPLAVGGEIGELDVTFTQQLDQYIDSVAPVAATFSNLNDVKGAVEAVQKKPTNWRQLDWKKLEQSIMHDPIDLINDTVSIRIETHFGNNIFLFCCKCLSINALY